MADTGSKHKLLTVLAGPASVVMVLAIVTLAAIVCAPVLHSDKAIATEVAMRVAAQRANTVAQSLLIRPASELPADFEPADHSFRARHLPGVLADSSATLPQSKFAPRAIQKLRAHPDSSARIMYQLEGKLHYAYMVSDRAGGALWIDLPIDSEREAVGRGFGHAYIGLTTAGYALLLLLLFAGFAIRTQLRAVSRLPEAERQHEVAHILGQSAPKRSWNLLPWMLALNIGLFVAEASGQFQNLSGIGYILAVVLSLSSNRPWHVLAVAGQGALLTMLAPLLSPYSAHWWNHLESQPVTIFALIAIGLFGSNHLRKAASESRALANMIQAQQENAATRDALARAERAEAEHVKMLERMSLSIECAGISIWEWDLKPNIVRATEGSPYSIRMGGKTEVTLEESSAVVHRDDLAEYQKVFVGALDPASPTSLITHRYRIVTPAGEARYIEFYGRVFRKPDGRVIRMLGIDWDITTEVEAQHALARQAQRLAEAERRLERASRLSSVGFYEIDLSRQALSWVSESYGALLGYSTDELYALGQGILELTHPEDHASAAKTFAMLLASDVPYDFPVRMRHKSGEYRWFRARGATEREADGTLLRSAGTLEDIQERKVAEDALREVEARFARAVLGTRDALFDAEMRSRVFWLSPRWHEMLGYEPNAFTLTLDNLKDYVHPEDMPRVESGFNAHFRDRTPFDIEYRLRKKNGDWLWVRSRGSSERDAKGRPFRFSGATQDATESRASREALVRASVAAEEASRAKSSFLATMSHEIRTPMNGIIGMTGLLLDSTLDRTQREYAETVRSSADSLLTILNDILDFSKIEAGKLEIECLELDLRSNVEEAGAIMAFQAAAKDLELIVNVRPEVPEMVLGDPQRVRQCLLNLVGNAIKFTTRGEVLVEVCLVGHKDGRPLVHFEVRDTGMGIPPDTLNRLFTPFTQADSSTTRRFGGTGLGLSIVRRLVELMGGTAGAESEVGKGSAFWFTLPLESSVGAESKTVEKLKISRGHLLLVDDNATNRRVLSSQLEHAGYDVLATSVPHDVVRLIRETKRSFDIVLLDYQMPDLDGEALGREILEAKDLTPTRLVLLTSLDHGGNDMQKFGELGFSGYLTKPIKTRELLACLDKVLAREAEPWNMRSQPIITRGTLLARKEQARLDGSILLVEDNAINQRVAQRFLERLGCRVEIASDGALGVEAYRTGKFDLILMDMQMPVMDGIEATQRIREIEGGSSHIPIVALTANAMMGQLERCLAAGMDDYLTKPLDIQRLEDTLERFLKARSAAPAEFISDAVEEAPQAMTDSMLTRLREIADGDTEFMQELVATFASAGVETIGELRSASQANDIAALGRAAHKLKGACANLFIEPLATYALELESQAKEKKSANWQEHVDRIATEFERVSRVLQEAMANESAAKRTG
jgi:PAS domain S-box-containing protein